MSAITVNIKGTDVPVDVSEDGEFSARIAGVRCTAFSLASLREKLLREVKASAASVAIPFSTVNGGRVRNGIAIAMRQGSRDRVIVRWEDDGSPGELTSSAYSRHDMRRLTDDQAAEWLALRKAHRDAEDNLDKFVAAHSFSLLQEVKDATAKAIEGDGTA